MDENEQVIDLELDEELDLKGPECIQAINSLNPGFKPFWTGAQLLKYYEERELTDQQMKAMAKALNEKAKEYLENHAEEAEAFLKGGEAPTCPSMTSMFAMVDKIFPETQYCPIEQLYARLEKLTGAKFKGVWSLKMNDKDTGIYLRTIESLWSSAIKFNHDIDETWGIVEKLVLKKLGINKQPWWRFWA